MKTVYLARTAFEEKNRQRATKVETTQPPEEISVCRVELERKHERAVITWKGQTVVISVNASGFMNVLVNQMSEEELNYYKWREEQRKQNKPTVKDL